MAFNFESFEKRLLILPVFLCLAFLITGIFVDWGMTVNMLIPTVFSGYVALWLAANILISLKLGRTDIIAMMWTPAVPEKIIVKDRPASVSFGYVVTLKLILFAMFGGLSLFMSLLMTGYFI